MIVKGEQVYLRYPDISDATVMLTWENDPEVWKAGENKSPYNLEDIQNFIAEGQDLYNRLQSRLMICLNNSMRPVGCIDLFDYSIEHQRAGLGILVYQESDRKKGYASEALKLLASFTKDHYQLNQLFCHVLKNNVGSLNLFKKVGFEIVGLKKAWRKSDDEFIDEYMLQLLLNK